MQKTKLGISVGLMGAILYFLALFCSEPIILIAAIAFVLFAEENVWLRRTAVKVLALIFIFKVIYLIIGFVPDMLDILNDIINIFTTPLSFSIINKLVDLGNDVVYVVKYIVFIVFGIMAFFQKSLPIPGIDSFIKKNVE